MWLHDMCNYEEMSLWINEEKKVVNTVKLILCSSSIYNLYTSQIYEFESKSIEVIQNFLDTLKLSEKKE